MSIKRKTSTIAALGSGAAALAMLTGLSSARADDLQINQQLLDTRVDQLAAVGQGAGGSGNPYFSIDQNPAGGAAVTAGSFPRSILIPGTDTSIKIYGQMTEIQDYYLTGGPVNGSPQSTTVMATGQLESAPLGTAGITKARSNGIYSQSPRESKFGVETRTPTPFGEARTVMEFDWAGSTSFVPGGADPTAVSDSLVPRIRYAYGTLGGLLAGQATSNFADPDANGETLDFGGNVGEPGKVRIPEIRYTMPAWWGTSFSVSAETPETQVGVGTGSIDSSDGGVIPTLGTVCNVTTGSATQTCSSTLATSGSTFIGTTNVNIAKATAPDLTAAWYIPQPWGHLDFSVVLLPGMDFTDGKYFDKQYIGYGGHFGADFKPGWFGWVKDDFILHIVAGDGIGSYLNASSNFALATNFGAAGTYGSFNGPTTAAAAAVIRATTVQEFGGEVGYQHWWLDNLRSNINAGFNAQNGIPLSLVGATAGGALNKEMITAHANLIWNPVSFIDLGVEYTWGQRTVLNNTTGTTSALISKFAFRF
jgi:Porin subfamily